MVYGFCLEIEGLHAHPERIYSRFGGENVESGRKRGGV